jgi:hypothetical protein
VNKFKSRTSVATRLSFFVVGLPLLLACAEREPNPELQRQLDELEAIRSENSQLLTEVAANARLMTEIGDEIDQVEGLDNVAIDDAESPMDSTHRTILNKVKQVTERLMRSEQQLAQSRRRLNSVGTDTDSLRDRIETLSQSIRDFESVVANQRVTLARLNEEIAQLEAEKLALQDTVGTLVAERNTAYYVVGTKEELLEQGIIVKEGGARVLFIFGKRGQTLRPARDLDTSIFTPIDIHQVTEIPLPDEAEYTIASRQDLAYLETPLDDGGKIAGSIRISDPEEFWTPSKFLIVVRG